MSELLDRIRREIRERMEAGRAAVLEHERLEAALHALSDAGSRATRAVTGRGQGSRASAAAPRSSGSVTPSTRARSSGQRSAASGADRRAAGARAGGAASARARRSSGAGAAARERSRPGAGTRARSATADRREAAAAAAAPTRKRAPRGANRAAVLDVIGERPGVSARELAAASRVTGGTLYTLLRRLTDEGTIDKRELPGGQAGYTLAAGGAAATADAQADSAGASTSAAAESPAPARVAQNRVDSPQSADAARSVPTDAQPR